MNCRPKKIMALIFPLLIAQANEKCINVKMNKFTFKEGKYLEGE